jgi:hypothetical protein
LSYYCKNWIFGLLIGVFVLKRNGIAPPTPIDEVSAQSDKFYYVFVHLESEDHSLSYCYSAEISTHLLALAIKPLHSLALESFGRSISPILSYFGLIEKLWRIYEEIYEYSSFLLTYEVTCIVLVLLCCSK